MRECVYIPVCVCVLFFCLPASVCERQSREGQETDQSTFAAVQFLSCGRFCVFIVMFRSSSSNSAPFCSQVHVCQQLLLSLSSLNVLDQICSVLYLLFYFKIISFFINGVLFNVFYLCSTDLTPITKAGLGFL